MSLSRFNQPFTLKMKPSLGKWLLIVLPHLFTNVMLFLVLKDIGILYFIVSMLCTLFSLMYFLRLYVFLSVEKSILEIVYGVDKIWTLSLKNNKTLTVELSPTSFSSNQLILLSFIDKSKKSHTALIMPDGVSGDKFRRLKVLIKTTTMTTQ